MKKILGLDLGSASVGWALITVENNIPESILGMGSRVIPLSTDDADEFTKGNAISKNQKRTQKRTQRKGYDRYQLRRANLRLQLQKMNMLPDESLTGLPALELWGMRARAVTEQVTPQELGRILLHINQKRGYKHSKADIASTDKNQTDYVQAVNGRHAIIRELDLTIGQYFFEKLSENDAYRLKDQVFPRQAYVEEFDAIIERQRTYYPDVLTEANVRRLRDEIIFYQRALKSCKHLVSVCDFEKRAYVNSQGETVFDGPKVAPRTSPLFQVCKIWESVNNIVLRNRNGEVLRLDLPQKQALFDFLNNNEKIKVNDLHKILGTNKREWFVEKKTDRDLSGNTTKVSIAKALDDYPGRDELLRFELSYVDAVDESTGEVRAGGMIAPDFHKQPLYMLWHALYSINKIEELEAVLRSKFGIEDDAVIERLCRIDFVKAGFGNKSAKAIRRILPYLQQGMMYSEACNAAGFRHSESLNREENAARVLEKKLELLKKGELRQPVVEKILNQMINVVNAVIDTYGDIDEIRVELARNLKQSQDERNRSYANNQKLERENKAIAERIQTEYSKYGITPSRRVIEKYKLWDEAQQRCFYCGSPVGVEGFLAGDGSEVEHIIPRSLFFDNSFQNKVCACRKCNSDKGNITAFDYMSRKPEAEFEDYKLRIEELYKAHKITKTKYERLLTPKDKIPTDFIDRQLRETQYISRKSKEILSAVCRNVWATSGSVTDFVRHSWGYDEVLHSLSFEKYKAAELTEQRVFKHNGQSHEEERIKDWSKRVDHRHHAIDALVVACTQQGFIQRINNLSALGEMQPGEDSDKKINLEKWINKQPHFSVAQVMRAVDGILISFKAGKKAASMGKRFKYVNKGKKVVLQKDIVIPRGPLSQESVYGKIKGIERNKPVKYLFENPELIFKPYIRDLVNERIAEYGGDAKKALASLKKTPIYLDKECKVELIYGTCYNDEYVIRYPLSALTEKDVQYIVDDKVREIVAERFKELGSKAFKDIEENPIYLNEERNIAIKNVRLYAKLSAVEPVKYDEQGAPMGFVKPANNHHVAIYIDKDGKPHEHIVTFWHAVERKKYKLPVVIKNPEEVWSAAEAITVKETAKDKVLFESFLENLPDVSWTFMESMQQNEMFVLGMDDESFESAIAQKDYAALSKHLYRVQKLTSGDYYFRHHLETTVDDKYGDIKSPETSKKIGKLIRTGITGLMGYNPHKVRINLLGEIVK